MKIILTASAFVGSVAAAKSGMEISRDEGCLWMGSDQDISLCRSGEAEFTVDGGLVVEGDTSVADLTVNSATFTTSSGSTNTLSDLDDSIAAAGVSRQICRFFAMHNDPLSRRLDPLF